jgi:hypothetical protein
MTFPLYLIATETRHLPFSPSDVIDGFEAASDDRVLRAIAWFERRDNGFVAWVGRTFKTAHNYYRKLEDRIDPVERVLKAMAGVERFTIYYGPPCDDSRVQEELRSILGRQRIKHIVWFLIDAVVSSVVIVFTPVLAPIPGPNVFFYYPVLRMLSHYRAIRGCAAGLKGAGMSFICLPELRGLEENLRAPQLDRRTVRERAASLNIRGLEQFLERMV